MNIKTDDKFWYDDITILVKKDKLLNFIPNKNATLNENLNSEFFKPFSLTFNLILSLL